MYSKFCNAKLLKKELEKYTLKAYTFQVSFSLLSDSED